MPSAVVPPARTPSSRSACSSSSSPPASPALVDTGHSHDVVSDLLDKQLAEAEQHAGPPVFVDVPPAVAPAATAPASPDSTEPGAAGKSTTS